MQLSRLKVGVWRPSSRPFTHSRWVAVRAKPQDTRTRFPHVKRGQFAEVTSEDINVFRNILSKESKVLSSSDELDGYNTDWIGIAKGNQSRLSWIQDYFVF